MAGTLNQREINTILRVLGETETSTQTYDILEALQAQSFLLINWNKENIEKEPEQVRVNIETILNIARFLRSESYV